MARGYDEPFTLYGLLARTVETDADAQLRHLHARSRGALLRRQAGDRRGRGLLLAAAARQGPAEPPHLLRQGRQGRGAVASASCASISTGADDRELPLILGLMPVLAKHAIDPETFEDTTLRADRSAAGPMWSARSMPAGASRSSAIRIIGAATLPINRGLWNFDEIRFDYYRDANSHFEAFKKGLYDVRTETDPGRWETGYDFPAVRDGRIVKETLPDRPAEAASPASSSTPAAPVFADIRVREAIAHAVRLRMGQPQFLLRPLRAHRRAISRAPNCRRAAGPADARERALLAPFPGRGARRRHGRHLAAAGQRRLRPRPRRRCKRALALLDAAGYELDGTELRQRATGEPLAFEILVTTTRRGAARARLRARPQARRHRGAGAPGRRRAIRPAATSPSIST